MVENIQITYFFPDSNQLNIRKAEKHNTDLNFFCAGFYFRLAERKWKWAAFGVEKSFYYYQRFK